MDRPEPPEERTVGIDISLDDAKETPAGSGSQAGGAKGGERRGCRPGPRRARSSPEERGRRRFSVSWNVLYGAPWGIITAALTLIWMGPRAPGANALFFHLLDHASEALSFAIYFGIVVGMFGYLVRAINPRRAYLPVVAYVQGFLFGAGLGLFAYARLDLEIVNLESPVLSYVLSCCLVITPVADLILLLLVSNRWRRESG